MGNEMDGDGDMDVGGDDIGPESKNQKLVNNFGRSDQVRGRLRLSGPVLRSAIKDLMVIWTQILKQKQWMHALKRLIICELFIAVSHKPVNFLNKKRT